MLSGQGLLAQSQGLPPTTISLQNDALAGVRYDNHWQLYFGAGYRHFNAGPDLLQGANLGGPDIQVTRRLSSHWGATGNVRGYYGTSGVVPNAFPGGTGPIAGPFVSEHLFLAGPELRGPRNAHAALSFHALAGGAYGNYTSDLGGHPPGDLGFYNNGLVFGGAFGGSLDLNRSAKWALRISPDLMLTHHGSEFQEQFGISVGLLYRFTNKNKKR